MQRSFVLDELPRALYQDFLSRCAWLRTVDVEAVDRAAQRTLVYLAAAPDERARLRPEQALEQRWYASLAAGTPDMSVYDDDLYLADLWACWVTYSREYLRKVRSARLLDELAPVRVVVDLGCGLGYTTAALAQAYPDALVIGTNLADTTQYAFARQHSLNRRFALASDLREVAQHLERPADLVFASEYFEHFVEPVAHLDEVLTLLRPRALLVANAFTARSIGHFDRYSVAGALLDGRATGRAFAQHLAQAGYTKVETQLWNDRPSLYRQVRP